MVNVVAVGATGSPGGIAVGTGGTEPSLTTTNVAPIGLNNAASTIVPLDGGETIAANLVGFGGSSTAHLRLVVLGYYEQDTGLDYAPINPCAIFDTRTGQGATGGFLGSRSSGSTNETTYQITGAPATAQGGVVGGCDIPAGTQAVLVNLVAIQPAGPGNFRAFATGTSPTGGVVNFQLLSPTMNNSNAVVVPLSALGQMDLGVNTASNNGAPTTHARAVVLGYYN